MTPRAALRRLALALAVLPAVILGACTGDTPPSKRSDRSSFGTASTAAPVSPPTTAAPAASTTTVPAFEGRISEIDDAIRARMTNSWRPGCPVPLADLRLLTLTYWGYDGVAHRGELVVNVDQAEQVVGAFRTLFDVKFPIERMELVDVYRGDDHASTVANNTAAFNCRTVVGNPGSWSEHAFGRAIDVNPRVNPYLLDPHVHDPELEPYIDRSLDAPGMIRPGDAAVRAFAAVGWQWGGAWSRPDYQHFSATGR